MSIFRNILGVFSAPDARIKLNPFAVYQAPQDTSLEYPHEVVWNILKINFLFQLEGPLEPIFEKKKKLQAALDRGEGKQVFASFLASVLASVLTSVLASVVSFLASVHASVLVIVLECVLASVSESFFVVILRVF